ncbi:hypothetical protein DFH07DRAFT_235591 [Mycena maculata]|uniref:Uncharacterized protein n=1 Tax=Mycena maculata TaxID=230809 RepID=A0AAD7MQ27_9AGAR|nr:hypothetical protein DFH07DRAFT_235591 [Mycena maculata]
MQFRIPSSTGNSRTLMHRLPGLRLGGICERLIKVGHYQTTTCAPFRVRMHQRRAQHTLSALPKEGTEPSEVDLRSSKRGRRGLRWIVSTLTPSLLTDRNYLDLSGIKRPRLSFPRTIDNGLSVSYERRLQQFIPFPPHARGFFYFGPRVGLPALAASLRFRCTPTAHPSSFDDGHDLLLPDGLPWQLLPAQAALSTSPGLRDQLVREGHLTPDELAKWRKRLGWVEGGSTRRVNPSDFLFALHQPFTIDFSRAVCLAAVGEEKVYPVDLCRIFEDQSERTCRYQFKGSALAHFERSPTTPHILHLRIVRLLSPITPSGAFPAGHEGHIVSPRADALLSVRHRRHRSPKGAPRKRLVQDSKPWALDLRKQSRAAEALRVLVGND